MSLAGRKSMSAMFLRNKKRKPSGEAVGPSEDFSIFILFNSSFVVNNIATKECLPLISTPLRRVTLIDTSLSTTCQIQAKRQQKASRKETTALPAHSRELIYIIAQMREKVKHKRPKNRKTAPRNQ